jgi:hypothetical protein
MVGYGIQSLAAEILKLPFNEDAYILNPAGRPHAQMSI